MAELQVETALEALPTTAEMFARVFKTQANGSSGQPPTPEDAKRYERITRECLRYCDD